MLAKNMAEKEVVLVHRCSRMMIRTSPLLLASLLLCSSSIGSAQEFSFFYFVQQWVGSFDYEATGCCTGNAFDDHSVWADSGEAHPQFSGRAAGEGLESSSSTHKHSHHSPRHHDHEPGSCGHLSRTPLADFGIHGLWPNYDADDKYPENCDASNDLDLDKISDLSGVLEGQWQTLSCKKTESSEFWAYEWKKHGTCSGLDQHSYFAAALDLKRRTNLLQTLGDAGVVPDGRSYSLGSIKVAIQAVTGFEPKIGCNHKNGRAQLYEVYVCVDTAGKEFVGCPVHRDEGCADEVVFPAFDPRAII